MSEDRSLNDAHVADRYQPASAICDDRTAAIAIIQMTIGLCSRAGFQARLSRVCWPHIADVGFGFTSTDWTARRTIGVLTSWGERFQWAGFRTEPHETSPILLPPDQTAFLEFIRKTTRYQHAVDLSEVMRAVEHFPIFLPVHGFQLVKWAKKIGHEQLLDDGAPA